MTAAQPVIKYDVDRDVRTVEAMASELTPYVYEPELYGPTRGDLPKLTIGGLLMRLHRLSAISSTLSPKQQQIVSTAQEQLDKVRKEWAVAYEGKISQELNTRISSLNQFIAECSEGSRQCAEIYPGGIDKRVIAESLNDEAERLNALKPEAKVGLVTADGKLHRLIKPGNFIWDARLEPAYPRDKYWFLYASFGG